MDKREDRRDRTWRKARRAQLAHLRVAHPGGAVDCPCEQSPRYFAKRHGLGCGCRGRKHGQPKLGVGICCAHDARAALVERRRWRVLSHAWRGAAVLDEVEA